MPSATHSALFASGNAPSPVPTSTNYDWSASNLPWTLNPGETLTDDWPSSALNMVVDIHVDATKDFVTNLDTTISQFGGPCIVRLGAGVYHIKNFSHPQTTANYGLGYYNSNLRGLLGQGADQTYVQMDANSYTQAQLDTIASLTAGSNGTPIGFSVMRFGSSGTPTTVYIAGLTFRGDDQQTISSYDSSTGISAQEAPYGGIGVVSTTSGYIQNVRFQASAHAATSQPPFECGVLGTQYCTFTMRRVEMDGRLSSDLDSSQPRRAGTWLGNNETAITLENVWMHHSNRSRYAVNDGNHATFGSYDHTHTKIEHITEIDDGLGGRTNAACAGYENCAATITWNQPIFHQDNAIAWNTAHVGLTTVTSQSVPNPAGGTIAIADPITTNVFTAMNGYFFMRVPTNTHWYTDGLNNTITVTQNGIRLQPHTISSNPSSTDLAPYPPSQYYLVTNA